jgi:hypothetical protein
MELALGLTASDASRLGVADVGHAASITHSMKTRAASALIALP